MPSHIHSRRISRIQWEKQWGSPNPSTQERECFLLSCFLSHNCHLLDSSVNFLLVPFFFASWSFHPSDNVRFWQACLLHSSINSCAPLHSKIMVNSKMIYSSYWSLIGLTLKINKVRMNNRGSKRSLAPPSQTTHEYFVLSLLYLLHSCGSATSAAFVRFG